MVFCWSAVHFLTGRHALKPILRPKYARLGFWCDYVAGMGVFFDFGGVWLAGIGIVVCGGFLAGVLERLG